MCALIFRLVVDHVLLRCISFCMLKLFIYIYKVVLKLRILSSNYRANTNMISKKVFVG